jgi:hypothetical protein
VNVSFVIVAICLVYGTIYGAKALAYFTGWGLGLSLLIVVGAVAASLFGLWCWARKRDEFECECDACRVTSDDRPIR